MAPPFRDRPSDRGKDVLLAERAALIERLARRVRELEGLLAKPKKTSQNSHTPPSQDRKPSGGSAREGKRRKPRPSRPGVTRRLTDAPEAMLRRFAETCPRCAVDVLGQRQTCRHRYEHIDIPPIRPHVTRIELYGGRRGACGKRFCAAPPEGMAPGTPFGVQVRALLLYLPHSHHIGFERLSRMMAELFGLTISEGAIANAFRRAQTAITTACAAIKEELRAAPG